MTEVSLHVRKCDLKLVFYIVIMKIKAGSQSIKETDVCYVARFLFGENGIVKLNKGSLNRSQPSPTALSLEELIIN